MARVSGNLINDILESKIKDKESIIKASRRIDAIREKFGKPEKGFNSTAILRKIRDSKLR